MVVARHRGVRGGRAQVDAILLDNRRAAVPGFLDQDPPWSYPTRGQCWQCHTQAVDKAIGLEVMQLDREVAYPGTGRIADQLRTWLEIGLLAPGTTFPEPAGPLPAIDDASAELAHRARAWLHANCSSCHRPGGGTTLDLDLRYTTPFAETHTCDVEPAGNTFGIEDARRIAPGSPLRSVLRVRIGLVGEGQMPPLARATVDEAGAALVSAWISEMSACPPGP
jgi:mono/diheme cytochrome c family protein